MKIRVTIFPKYDLGNIMLGYKCILLCFIFSEVLLYTHRHEITWIHMQHSNLSNLISFLL